MVFRYDDFSADRPGDRATNPVRAGIWSAEQEIGALFKRYSMPYVLGVVPSINTEDAFERPFRAFRGLIPLSGDEEKCRFLIAGLRDNRIEVAMHGFSHTNHAAPRWAAGEFHRPFAAQLAGLKAGRRELARALGDQSIETFIPPFNSWDDATATGLKETGFSIVSADLRQPLNTETNLHIVPFTAHLWELEALLDRPDPDSWGGLVVVLYHPSQIVQMQGRESRYFGVPRFVALLERLAQNPSVRVTTFKHLVSQGEPLDIVRYRAGHRVWWHRGLWNGPLPHCGALASKRDPYYRSAVEYRKQSTRWLVWLLFCLVGSALCAGVLARLIRPLFGMPGSAAVPAAVGMLLLLAVLRVQDLRRRGFRGTATTLAPLPLCLGFLLGWLLV